jgi:hypothetical protein
MNWFAIAFIAIAAWRLWVIREVFIMWWRDELPEVDEQLPGI